MITLLTPWVFSNRKLVIISAFKTFISTFFDLTYYLKNPKNNGY